MENNHMEEELISKAKVVSLFVEELLKHYNFNEGELHAIDNKLTELRLFLLELHKAQNATN